MTLEQIYLLAEIVAAIAVVASLIYLSIQIRNSRSQAKSDAIDLITKERSEFVKMMAQDQELSLIVPKGLAAKSKLPANEYYRFNNFLYYIFITLESGYRKWENNDLDEELWKGWDEAVYWWLLFPGVQTWWVNNIAPGYTESFKKYINNNIEKIKVEGWSANKQQIKFMEEAGKLQNNNEKLPPTKRISH
ncbi:hypothetical protein [uncultured Eudoraea sp.]|uniref:hypothetical protein n=1 Tax=uncultured Eudoraea sp. TaxID=1035614 RepID=UPI00261134AB|nr:hypothetical protein [uncultured Eudoraea sp.]